MFLAKKKVSTYKISLKSQSDSIFFFFYPENSLPFIFGTNFASCLGILTIEVRKVQVFIDTNFLMKKTFCFVLLINSPKPPFWCGVVVWFELWSGVFWLISMNNYNKKQSPLGIFFFFLCVGVPPGKMGL